MGVCERNKEEIGSVMRLCMSLVVECEGYLYVVVQIFEIYGDI